MKIIERLKVQGANEVNAVMLDDNGERYPVFLKSLHNKITFDELIKSGYKLYALPYGFVKDGVKMDDLPINTFNCTEQEIDRMYFAIGESVSDEELKSHFAEKEIESIPIPETHYTIFTREEFLKYLDEVGRTSLDDDFKPINYFVHPDAQFTLNEFFSSEYTKYTNILDRRRTMSVVKYRKLVNFLHRFGLAENFTFHDVMDAYFAWGIDGLNVKIADKQRTSSQFVLDMRRNVVKADRLMYGLIDGSGNLYPPTQEGYKFKALGMDSDSVKTVIEGMDPDEVKEHPFRADVKVSITTLIGEGIKAQYSRSHLYINSVMFPTLSIQAPYNKGTTVEPYMALEKNEELLYETSVLYALATEIVSRREPDIKTCSYDVLRRFGLSPRTALQYIVAKKSMYFMAKFDPTAQGRDDDLPQVTFNGIDQFLSLHQKGLVDADRETITGIIQGDVNIDALDMAKQLVGREKGNVTKVFNLLSALHNVWGTTLEEMRNELAKVPAEGGVMTINGPHGLKCEISVRKSEVTAKAAENDIVRLSQRAAEECSWFSYITLVAGEVGSPEVRRHVGVEFLYADRNDKAVKQLIGVVSEKFDEKVATTSLSASDRKLLEYMKMPIVLNRYFEIALKGTITWPAQLGGGTESVSYDLQQNIYNTLIRSIESTVAYCNFAAVGVANGRAKLDSFCVNAFVTPEYVIPRSGCTLHVVPFYALWYNYRDMSPNVFQQLVDKGVLDPNFVCWDTRYANSQFEKRDMYHIDNVTSLYKYYTRARKEVAEYPSDMEFKSVLHPVVYNFPGLYLNDEGQVDRYADCAELPEPRVGAPKVKLGSHYTIDSHTYDDIFRPQKQVSETEYIRGFVGHTADALMSNRELLTKIPAYNPVLMVDRRTGSIYNMKTQEYMDFHRITELDNGDYPVMHIYNRTYMLRDIEGNLWEVAI